MTNTSMIQSSLSRWLRGCLAVCQLASWTIAAYAQTGPTVWTAPSLTRVGQTDPAGTVITAQLEAARGEYESFQVIVRAPAGTNLTNANVTMSELIGPGGAIIPQSSYSIFREYYVNVTANSPAWAGSANMPLPKGWYPDALIPFIDPSTGLPPSSGTLVAAPFTVSAGQNQPIWVDLLVPRNATAGQYTGSYTVTTAQGNFTGSVALTVWNFTLPVVPSLHSSFQYWTAGTLAGNEELLRNRLQPYTVPAATESTLLPLGYRDYNLAYWSGANIGTCSMPAPPSVSQLKSTVAAQQPGLDLYNYTADEVGACTNLYTALQQWGLNLHQAGVNQLVTMAPVPQLFSDGSGTGRSAVDIWVVLPDMYDANTANIQSALAKGDQVWSYNTLIQDADSPKWEIDYPPINFRIQPGFINQSLNLNGLLYWRIDLWSSDPWNNVYGYGSYPGEGQLVYPGSTAGIQGVAPSMRLKYLRDGVDDFEYIQLLKAAGQGAWALQVAAGVGANWSTWTRDPNVLTSARHQLGQQLDALGGGSTPQPPSAPANPSPANGATGLANSLTLSWTGDNTAISYDVYFGTALNPPLAITVSGPSYSPGTLAADSVYFWRVVAKNSNGSTSSATWSFTTQGVVPSVPGNLSPATGSTAVSTTPALTWSASSGATSYDVYFGTASTPPLALNTTSTSYSPGALSGGITYYWRVVAKNSFGSATSPAFSFTTASSAPPGPPPTGAVSVSPSSGSGKSPTFAFTFSNSAGFTALNGGTVIINSTLAWANTCWIYFDRKADLIWLSSDNTATWTSAAPGSSTVLQNSQCSISASGASVTAGGQSVTVNIPITFKAAFDGTKKVFMSTNTASGNSTLTSEGTWVVQ